MYIVDGIAYAGNPTPLLTVCGVRPLDDYKLWVRFSTGEAKTFDVKPLFEKPVFKPLADRDIFNAAYIDYGTVVWADGSIDISPDWLYEEGTLVVNNERGT
jgi:hypothetical protein